MRLDQRWQQLPLDQAHRHLPTVRGLAQRLADESADRAGQPRVALPELGPGVVMDQLTVAVYDLSRARQGPAGGQPEGRPGTGVLSQVWLVGSPELGPANGEGSPDGLAQALAGLRRTLSGPGGPRSAHPND